VLEYIGDAVRLDESTGEWHVVLTENTADDAIGDCTELVYYVLTRKPVPPNLDFRRGRTCRRAGICWTA